MTSDLTLPVARLPGIVEVAREVLGIDVWHSLHPTHMEIDVAPLWWRVLPGSAGKRTRVVPLSLPAGRLVAETWLPRPPTDPVNLRAACLDYGDLLTALSGDLDALEIEDLDGDGTWDITIRNPEGVNVHWQFGVDPHPEDGVWDVPALAGITDPRAALDAIAAEVCP